MNHLNIINNMLSNISINIKLSIFCRHKKGWTEHKTKANYTLWCIQSGSLFIEMNNKTFSATAGDVVFFYPGDTYKMYSPTACSFLVFFFSLETGNSIDLLKGLNVAGIYHDKVLQKKCLAFCKQYLSSFNQSPAINLQLYAAFFSFIAEVLNFTDICENFYEAASFTPDTLIHYIISYMNEHYREPVSMKELAALADMSEKYFIRYFHFHIGIPPKQYLVELRMKHAIELLSSTNRSIAEIASELGYSDQYCFSKAFRKYYGETPSKFRRHSY